MNIADHDDRPPAGCYHKYVPGWGQGTFPTPWSGKPHTTRARKSRVLVGDDLVTMDQILAALARINGASK